MSKEQEGKVIQVIGAVVDIAFDENSELPFASKTTPEPFRSTSSAKPCSTSVTALYAV